MTCEKQNPDPIYPFMCGVATGYGFLALGLLLMLGCSGDAGNNLLPPTDAGDAASQEGGGKDGQGSDAIGSDGGGGESTTDASAEPGKEGGVDGSAEGGSVAGDRLPVPATKIWRFASLSYTADVAAFELDRAEVTVARFRKFVDAGFGTQGKPPADGSGAHPAESKTGWRWTTLLPKTTADLKAIGSYGSATWADAPGPNEDLPVNYISWSVAFAFCVWDGGRLPSQAEWNAAAVGGEEARAYPWGDESPTDRASCSTCGTKVIVSGDAIPAGRGRWGHENLAGNLAEYMIDSGVKTPAPCGACVVPVASASGLVWTSPGSWTTPDSYISSRYYAPSPANAVPHVGSGFRCAR